MSDGGVECIAEPLDVFAEPIGDGGCEPGRVVGPIVVMRNGVDVR
jgi:hypothetical protein